MAARSIGTLTISFGLVAIPVSSTPRPRRAGRSRSTCCTRRAARVCGSSISASRKTFRFRATRWPRATSSRRDQYVMFSPEELKALEEAGTQTADINEFVPISAIDPVYSTRRITSRRQGRRETVCALREGTARIERCAVGRWAARGKQYIVMIRPVDDGLVMQQLMYAGEVRPISEIDIPHMDVARRRIEARQTAHRPADERDVRSLAVHRRSQRARRKGRAEESRGRGDHDVGSARNRRRAGHRLMEALRASLEKKGVKPAASKAADAPPKGRKPAKHAQSDQAEAPAPRRSARK